jgi:hypothetical protein
MYGTAKKCLAYFVDFAEKFLFKNRRSQKAVLYNPFEGKLESQYYFVFLLKTFN